MSPVLEPPLPAGRRRESLEPPEQTQTPEKKAKLKLNIILTFTDLRHLKIKPLALNYALFCRSQSTLGSRRHKEEAGPMSSDAAFPGDQRQEAGRPLGGVVAIGVCLGPCGGGPAS